MGNSSAEKKECITLCGKPSRENRCYDCAYDACVEWDEFNEGVCFEMKPLNTRVLMISFQKKYPNQFRFCTADAKTYLLSELDVDRCLGCPYFLYNERGICDPL